ncbi:hypothetical protein [Massilia phosphatilytica]
MDHVLGAPHALQSRFHTGLRIAAAVVGLTGLTYHFADLPTATAVAIGAATTRRHLPSPLRHKFK